jgi:hypothetical protein
MQVDLHDTGLELGSLSNRPSVVRNNQHQSKDFRHRSRACACHVDKQSNIERQSQASHPVCDSKIGHRRLHVFSHWVNMTPASKRWMDHEAKRQFLFLSREPKKQAGPKWNARHHRHLDVVWKQFVFSWQTRFAILKSHTRRDSNSWSPGACSILVFVFSQSNQKQTRENCSANISGIANHTRGSVGWRDNFLATMLPKWKTSKEDELHSLELRRNCHHSGLRFWNRAPEACDLCNASAASNQNNYENDGCQSCLRF